MPQIRSYPQAVNLLPTDAIPLDRIGSGTEWIAGSDLGGGGGGQQLVLITASGISLAVNTLYAAKTGATALTVTLPQLSLQASPQFVDLFDIDNNAGVNNITINAFSGDQISDHGALSSAYVIGVSNMGVRLFVNTNSWTAIPLGS